MTNKSLATLFVTAIFFVLTYFFVLPKTELKEPTVNAPHSATASSHPNSSIETSVEKSPVSEAQLAVHDVANPAALKKFDQFTPTERDRLRLDFAAMSEPERLFAVISAEDEAWKKDNFFPDKNYIENSNEVTLEDLALNHMDKLATNALIYKWWLRKDPRWKELAQEAVTVGSSFAARLLLYEALNTPGKAPNIEEVISLQISIILSGDDASARFMLQRYSIYSHADAGDALSILSQKVFNLNNLARLDIKAGRPTYPRRTRPIVPWIKAY